ncbi:primary-amine oxidase [Kibdelosporangium banguiense]|uniref:Amine oxidase n=1 Tax=Kibdelosporangium banguiense TaxID=1365924 RepID=A0ABS4TW61_9PSEU|nr:primary-amine oxidase [Kibdelosporangium banguiense]MBP2328208.1 primary-amine oxidase [Kibdelosporangium banguiense]
MSALHPYDPLSADEITAAVNAVRSGKPELTEPRFPLVRTDPPAKDVVRRQDPAFTRAAFLVVYDRADAATYEARVDLATGKITDWAHIPGVQPAIMIEEIMMLDEIVRNDPAAVAALARHGVHDLDLLQIDPWSTGTLPVDGVSARRRIIRASAYVREYTTDNGYARPVGNLVFVIDCNDKSVAAIQEGDPIPLPPESGNYDVDSVGPLRTDLRPLEIIQSQGPSFTVTGHVIEWQRWRMHVHIDAVEGLVISDVSYLDGDRRRSILHRAAISEMVVPYGDTSNDFYFRNVFDAGEYNLGKTVGSLSLGCDCLGEIRYLDAVLADEAGTPQTITNAICMHEEDYGILWKHWNFRYTDQPEVRRSRRFVVSAIHTIGNYEYGFFWYFYLDGTIQFEAKLTGIVQTRAVAPGATPEFGTLVAPQLDAPNHQHLFNMRLDFEVDGPNNTVLEVDAVGMPMGPGNEHGNAIVARKTEITNERDARRACDPTTARTWKVINPGVTNRFGEPVGYKLVPFVGPTLLAAPESDLAKRAEFARHHLWVTRYHAAETHAAGDYPNQHPGDGLGEWVKQERDLVNQDIVLWHTFGTSHLPRPEDWPIMPCDYVGFSLKPAGFFDRNPALDIPPPSGQGTGHCHA